MILVGAIDYNTGIQVLNGIGMLLLGYVALVIGKEVWDDVQEQLNNPDDSDDNNN